MPEMRREFIIFLVGVICISTITSFLSGYVQVNTDKVLLDTVVGAVGEGNFSYWQLEHTGPLLVELTSLSGDADLYVSDTLRPGYEVDKNNFSSTTCGADLVSIPTDFPRPIGIGVFGHWSSYLSEYSIQVYLETRSLHTHMQMFQHGHAQKYDLDKKTKDKSQQGNKPEEERPRFLKLLNILDMIFEMFVL